MSLIPKDLHSDALAKAYDVAVKLRAGETDKDDIPQDRPGHLIRREGQSVPLDQRVDEIQEFISTKQQDSIQFNYNDENMLPKNFASWLSCDRSGNFTLEISDACLDTWDSEPMDQASAEHLVVRECQYLRLMLHEFGHYVLHPHLFTDSSRPYGQHADCDDESQAWAFAFGVLGLLLSDYAKLIRDGNMPEVPTRADDTVRMLI